MLEHGFPSKTRDSSEGFPSYKCKIMKQLETKIWGLESLISVYKWIKHLVEPQEVKKLKNKVKTSGQFSKPGRRLSS